MENLETIWNMFKKHKDIFPYFRKDYLAKKIADDNVILICGVAIIFGVYKRNQKIGENCQAKSGDYYISEIVSNAGNGTEVIQEFFAMANSYVWLTVRKDNTRACQFYEKNGMINVGKISWKQGTIPGLVYLKHI